MPAYLTPQERTTLPASIAKAVHNLRAIAAQARQLRQAQALVLIQKSQPPSAYAMIRQLASDKVAKGLAPTLEQAIAVVAKERPDLRARYAQESHPIPVVRKTAAVVPEPSPIPSQLNAMADALVVQGQARNRYDGLCKVAQTQEGQRLRKAYDAQWHARVAQSNLK